MKREDKAQLLWAISFVLSGVIFIFAFWLSPVIGALYTLGYIVLYVGLSIVFLMVFKEMGKISKDTIENLKSKRNELIEIKKAIENKYYKRKIDKESFSQLIKDYERKITEIEVKIKNLEKGKSSF